MKKFKELSSKEQLGIYAGLVLLIGAFLPFAGVDFGGFGSASVKLTSWDIGFLGWIGAIVGAVAIFLKQPLIAAIGFAAAGVAVAWATIDTLTSEFVGLKFGAFVCIAAAVVGVWATVDALVAKLKS